MKSHSPILITFIAVFHASLATASPPDATKIETKYLMFRLPKIHFDKILQLKKPGGKLDFGDGTVLTHDDIEPIATDQPKNFAYRITLKKALKFQNVVLGPKCVLTVFEFKDKVTNRYLLDSIDCESSAVEIDRTKLKGVFHSTFAKDEHHFACNPVVSVTDVPLVGGSKVPPGHFISADDFDPDKPINKVKSISKDHSN